jgi:kinesin family protein 20
MVDLAGSERAKHTQNTGDRLREASHINTGLMSLGRCMEIVRLNQHDKRKTLVPYKHSKLTEIFKSFFLGEGSAVMLVCVNPFDTGFDENSHVMRFAAVARSIQTTATATTSKFVPVPESSDIDEGKSLIGAPWSCFGTDVLFRLVS